MYVSLSITACKLTLYGSNPINFNPISTDHVSFNPIPTDLVLLLLAAIPSGVTSEVAFESLLVCCIFIRASTTIRVMIMSWEREREREGGRDSERERVRKREREGGREGERERGREREGGGERGGSGRREGKK